MSTENRIVLQSWVGQTPDGHTAEKSSFQIFVEGQAVSQRREGKSRELIGFVGKRPGMPINFLPVVAAFRDLIPHFEVQIRTALLEWRAAQVAEAQARFAQLQSSVDTASDDLTKQFAADALAAAESVIEVALADHEVEKNSKRAGNAPSEEAIEQLRKDAMKPANDDESEESDASAQNL